MRICFLVCCFLSYAAVSGQEGPWRAELHRKDSASIVFNFDWKKEAGRPVWYIRNADERIRVDNIDASGDSFVVQMPVFESEFRFAADGRGLNGSWIKKGALRTQVLPFSAVRETNRFTPAGTPTTNVTGRWSVRFAEEDSNDRSVAEFTQRGNLLTGTFLNTTGDYRYLEGIVTRDSMVLSAFDGSHAFLFTGTIKDDHTIANGVFYSGGTAKEHWTAVKDSVAALAYESVEMSIKPGAGKFKFSFRDLEGKPVSYSDERFRNKILVVQLMGSWCPNCMDETAFLSDYYNSNKQRGVEVVALAYEYSTDWERSVKSLRKFQQRFNVQYPILNTGVAVTDSLRTEKTLPQVTRIKTFPSSLIIDKQGRIRKLDTGFNGPATGAHYTAYKKEFEATINALLAETPSDAASN